MKTKQNSAIPICNLARLNQIVAFNSYVLSSRNDAFVY